MSTHRGASQLGGNSPGHDLIILAYEQGLKGYAYRDQLIPHEFSRMLQAFFFFVALMAGTQAFLEVDRALGMFILLGIAVTGCFALGGFLVDLAANTSSKRELRRGTDEIERVLYPPGWGGSYWALVSQRSFFSEERAASVFIFEGSAATGFVWAARLLFGLWLFLSVLVIFWGHAIGIKA